MEASPGAPLTLLAFPMRPLRLTGSMTQSSSVPRRNCVRPARLQSMLASTRLALETGLVALAVSLSIKRVNMRSLDLQTVRFAGLSQIQTQVGIGSTPGSSHR